jgi:hypothetical protein
MVAQKRRKYSEKQREAVLKDVVRLGVCEAASKHGVPESCVSRWAKEAGVRRGQVQTEDEAKAHTPPAKQKTRQPVLLPLVGFSTAFANNVFIHSTAPFWAAETKGATSGAARATCTVNYSAAVRSRA